MKIYTHFTKYMKNLEEIELSDSSSEIHPNIDERSYKNWKRQLKQHEKQKLRKREQELKSLKTLTQSEQQELLNIQSQLEPKYVVVEDDNNFKTSTEKVSDIDFCSELSELIKDSTINKFLEIVDENKLNLDQFEEFVLYNLSENIKEGNDEAGLILCRLSLLTGYYRNQGADMMMRLQYELRDEKKKEKFDQELKEYYEQSKEAILNMQ